MFFVLYGILFHRAEAIFFTDGNAVPLLLEQYDRYAYTISKMDNERSGRQVYCVITDAYGNKVQTKTVTLKIIQQ